MGQFRGAHLLAVTAIGLPFIPSGTRADTVLADPIALIGQPAPGTSGSFASFQRPLINNHGDVAFIADDTASAGGLTSQGVWLAPQGLGPANVAHGGQDAPGAAAPFNLFQDLRLNDAAQVAFGASTGSDVTFATGGIWRGALSGPPDPIALRSAIPGAQLSAFNNLGQATVLGSDASNSNTTVWFGRSTSDLAPAAALGPTHVFGNIPLTTTGQVALAHNLVDSSDPQVTVGYEILAGQASAPATLIIRGPSEPVAVGSMNDAGQVAFSATGRVWIGQQAAGVAPVVGPASAVPGVPGASFGAIDPPAINHSGQIAFRADLAGPGLSSANSSGIFSGTDADTLQRIARTGEAVPRAPGFVISTLGTPQINAAGQMIFTGTVASPGEPSDSAIFGYDPQTGLRLLVRSGDLLQIGPGEVERVLSVSLGTDAATTAGGEDGLGADLNGAGEFAFIATLTNGQSVTDGVFLASIPEPIAAPACGALLLCAFARRSRRPRPTASVGRPPGL